MKCRLSLEYIPCFILVVMHVPGHGIVPRHGLIEERKLPRGVLTLCLEYHQRPGKPDSLAFV